MERLEELERKYAKLPKELKNAPRWVGFWRTDKVLPWSELPIPAKCPMNAINGKKASTIDSNTWTNFSTAIKGCVKYNFDGIGFMLGDGIFGVDLDNHEKDGEKPMSSQEFQSLISEFVVGLESYAERSQSGDGVHIICKGKLPVGARRRNNTGVEMYDDRRYFAMTGDVVNDSPVMDREKEIIPLWTKYLKEENNNNTQTTNTSGIIKQSNGSMTFGDGIVSNIVITPSLSVRDLLEKIKASKDGPDFMRLFQGDITAYGNDHSAADMAFCDKLAFWCGRDTQLMDEIFRMSALMREKWDRRIGDTTYGQRTLKMAIAHAQDTYTPPREKIEIKTVQPVNVIADNNSNVINIDENGDPIIPNVKQIFKTKSYSLDDTGNAERFYDYFGHLFRYNKDNKIFAYWNGKTWVADISSIYVKKYANALIDILKNEANAYEQKIQKDRENGCSDEEYKQKQKTLGAMLDNVKRVSNKAGKEAMISEFTILHNLPAFNSDFDTQEFLLNTDSGVVNLESGEIMAYDPKYLISKNTNCMVSYEEPEVWLKFLKDVFWRNNEEETQQIIDTVQLLLGDSLTGRTNKEYLVILYGSGSNGKSTFVDTINTICGEYGKTMNSALLTQNPNASSQSNEFAIAALLGARMIATSETAAGKKLDDITLKQMTSSEKISAQFKYGAPFSFRPTWTPWMSTNNKPIIRATDFGVWRRIFFIPFLNTFSGDKKDVTMPKKLMAEAPKILGWMIKGSIRFLNECNYKISKPKCIEEALSEYKSEMDTIGAWINENCYDVPTYKTKANELFEDYQRWALKSSEYCMPKNQFFIELVKKGYRKSGRTAEGYFYYGLKLNSDKVGHVFQDTKDE